MKEQGIMYRLRQSENPGEVGLDNFQRLSSGREDGVILELWASGYDVIREVPLVEEDPVTLYAASDNRNGNKGDRFFAVWVRVDPEVPPETRSLSRIFEIVGHAVNNGARGTLLGVSSSAE